MSDTKPNLSPLGAEIAASLEELAEVLKSGEPLETRFTVRTATLNLEPHDYAPDDVKAVRRKLGASQPLLASFIGVSVRTLRSWEQGTRPVPAMAARYLDDIQAFPEIWTKRIQLAAK